MYEVRLHGRGGQGAVMAANMLASGVVAEGRFAVAIPSFGFERRGAPVAAFVRIDEREIRRMTNITHPHCVMCIDPTLSRSVDIFAGLQPGGAWVQATDKPISELVIPDAVAVVGVIDAVRIALEIFGRPITNTLMLGALARTAGIVTLDGLKNALAHSDFRDAGLQQNLLALERGFAETAVKNLRQAAA
jgi:phenylglyoxylate dehydrogenase gamma subunit